MKSIKGLTVLILVAIGFGGTLWEIIRPKSKPRTRWVRVINEDAFQTIQDFNKAIKYPVMIKTPGDSVPYAVHETTPIGTIPVRICTTYKHFSILVGKIPQPGLVTVVTPIQGLMGTQDILVQVDSFPIEDTQPAKSSWMGYLSAGLLLDPIGLTLDGIEGDGVLFYKNYGINLRAGLYPIIEEDEHKYQGKVLVVLKVKWP